MSGVKRILLLLALMAAVSSAVTVTPIANISANNLVFSGSIPLSTNDSLFFTYYGVDGETNQDNLKNHPLLIVVGSPGTSAQYYSLAGIGPLNLQNDMTLAPNAQSFTNTANVMFLDLLGSGFSFAADPESLPTEIRGYGQQLSTAINAFVKESVLGQSSILTLAGEGTFIRALPGLEDIASLKGIMHMSSWPELYAVGKNYGSAGIDLGLYGSAEKIAIDSTFTTCYNNIRSSKFYEAHLCLDAIYNFVEEKSKNANLLDTRLKSNLTEFLPMVQYYFSQTKVVSQWRAPSSKLFETQSAYVANKTYVDLAKNYTTDLSTFMRDYYSIHHWFVVGHQDYISYYKGVRSWIENELNFVEKAEFKAASLEDLVIDGKTVGYYKTVKQVGYCELIDAGHHLFHDSNYLTIFFKGWIDTLKIEEQAAVPRHRHISTE